MTTSTTERIGCAGRVYDEREIEAAVAASREFWLTHGKYGDLFEQKLSAYLGVKHTLLVNSGSSANLLAFMALTDYSLGESRIKRGDEVITVAACFPTTISPMILFGAVPVFLDVNPLSYNLDVSQLERALSPKTKAVMLAHTLGIPFNLDVVTSFCRKHDLFLIEDNCDALGSRYHGQLTGTFGHIGTSSFYPAHHITMGEGGAVYTSDDRLARILRSLRDWGRDCQCACGEDNHCGRRFSHQHGSLPEGYDHKYVYSRFGFNLKATEMQAAIGCVQLDRIDEFTRCRRENARVLMELLEPLGDLIRTPMPEPDSDPSWFGLPLHVVPWTSLTRERVVETLEKEGIQTRPVFAGNITRHPCFDGLREDVHYRVASLLWNTDRIMNNAFWVGVYPGLNRGHMERIASTIARACGL